MLQYIQTRTGINGKTSSPMCAKSTPSSKKTYLVVELAQQGADFKKGHLQKASGSQKRFQTRPTRSISSSATLKSLYLKLYLANQWPFKTDALNRVKLLMNPQYHNHPKIFSSSNCRTSTKTGRQGGREVERRRGKIKHKRLQFSGLL